MEHIIRHGGRSAIFLSAARVCVCISWQRLSDHELLMNVVASRDSASIYSHMIVFNKIIYV